MISSAVYGRPPSQHIGGSFRAQPSFALCFECLFRLPEVAKVDYNFRIHDNLMWVINLHTPEKTGCDCAGRPTWVDSHLSVQPTWNRKALSPIQIHRAACRPALAPKSRAPAHCPQAHCLVQQFGPKSLHSQIFPPTFNTCLIRKTVSPNSTTQPFNISAPAMRLPSDMKWQSAASSPFLLSSWIILHDASTNTTSKNAKRTTFFTRRG